MPVLTQSRLLAFVPLPLRRFASVSSHATTNVERVVFLLHWSQDAMLDTGTLCKFRVLLEK